MTVAPQQNKTPSISLPLPQFCRLFGTTVLVSLLQPPPEVYFLFDDVVLTSAG